jgi:hypothetical protein
MFSLVLDGWFNVFFSKGNVNFLDGLYPIAVKKHAINNPEQQYSYLGYLGVQCRGPQVEVLLTRTSCVVGSHLMVCISAVYRITRLAFRLC